MCAAAHVAVAIREEQVGLVDDEGVQRLSQRRPHATLTTAATASALFAAGLALAPTAARRPHAPAQQLQQLRGRRHQDVGQRRRAASMDGTEEEEGRHREVAAPLLRPWGWSLLSSAT